MKKALALILGITFIFATIPSIGAFADSDPGITNQLITNIFTWNTATPYIDSAGWIYNNYLESATLVSSGNISHPIPQAVVSLTNPGDYFEVSFDTDIVSSWATSGLFLISIAYDSFTSSGTHYSIPDGAVNCYFCGVEAFYIFQNTMPAADRNWRSLNFIVNSEYLSTTTIRIEYDGIPCTFPIAMIRIQQWRQTAINNFTQEQIINMQNNLLTALNVARLADIIGIIEPNDIDLTTLETTTASILQKLANVPDIIQYIDQIETIDSNILNSINTFYQYYINLFDFDLPVDHAFNVYVYNETTETFDLFTSRYKPNTYYYLVPVDPFLSNKTYYISLYFDDYTSAVNNFHIEYYLSRYNTLYYNRIYNNINTFTQYYYSGSNLVSFRSFLFEPHYMSFVSGGFYPIFRFKFDDASVNYSTSFFKYSFYDNDKDFYHRILWYLKYLVYGDSDSVSSSIEQTNDTVAEQIDDITSFEDIYNQSLDTSASQIDVSSYQITQTSGMSWMRTYTEYNFDQMQNFRILFLTPLVLALAAFFLRRKQ